MDTLDRYKNVFKTTFEVEDNALNDEFIASDVEKWDSITHLSLITALEDEFDIMIESEDLMDLRSFEKGKQILTKYDIDIN